MRVPHAARTLHETLGQRYKKPTMKPSGDADAFGVYRSVEFDKTSSGLLKKALPVLNDPRISGYEVAKNGTMTVTFVDGINADRRDPFTLDAAETVADAEAKGGSEEPDSGSGDA